MCQIGAIFKIGPNLGLRGISKAGNLNHENTKVRKHERRETKAWTLNGSRRLDDSPRKRVKVMSHFVLSYFRVFVIVPHKRWIAGIYAGWEPTRAPIQQAKSEGVSGAKPPASSWHDDLRDWHECDKSHQGVWGTGPPAFEVTRRQDFKSPAPIISDSVSR